MLVLAKALIAKAIIDDCVIFYQTQVKFDLDNSKKQKKLYDMKHHFQDTWVAKLPWAKFMIGVNRKVHKIKCKVCNKIEGHDKLLCQT
jgi:hypothetical protein